MLRLLVALSVLAILASPSLAQGLNDEYRLEGTNPGGQGKYRGSVQIKETGETYQVAWTIGNQQYAGTGVVQGDTFSVVFQPRKGSAGIAVYKIRNDGTLEGSWANLAGSKLGAETWRPDQGF